MALHRHRLSSSRSSSSCSSNGVAVLLQYRMAESPLLSQILRLYSCHLDQKEADHSLEWPASFFCLFARFELATRGSKCEAFGRNSPGDCFAASALYFCARLRISAGGAAGMACFLFCLFTRFELATRGSKCVAFGRNSPGDCFVASALYFCARLLILSVEQPECPASFFCLFARFELATRGSKCEAFGRNSPGDCFAARASYCCDRLSFFSSGAALFLRRCSLNCPELCRQYKNSLIGRRMKF